MLLIWCYYCLFDASVVMVDCCWLYLRDFSVMVVCIMLRWVWMSGSAVWMLVSVDVCVVVACLRGWFSCDSV